MASTLGALAAIPLRTAQVNERLEGASARVANATTPAQTRTAAANLSAAQFSQAANRVRSVSDVSDAVTDAASNTNGVPDVSEPGYSPQNSIGRGLYT